ncbi:MAG: ShlB/FhaC/HecB family hemolysin secretion/activation protein, partial [Polaromonas sp.]|uniref:ShlB/FhaC/HecB family hemolysin secretion/activation protein n=1 Tax=Polaromonas sp. TaxID=1869339 RepID=UPI004036691F
MVQDDVKRSMTLVGERRGARVGAARPAVAGLAGWGLSLMVLAQVVPPATDPGRLRERFDVQTAPNADASPPELDLQRPSGLPDSLKSIRVTLQRIRVEGSSVLPASVLQSRTEMYTGREIGGGDILQLASELTAMYRNAGYILSLVLVPPQSLSEGTLTLQVIEGYISAVTVQAGEGVSATVREALARIGEQIKASRPLDALVLERYLLIANDYPGLELRSVLSPSRVQGAADLTLVASIKRFEGFASVDNYGSRYLGPGQMLAGVTGNQLLGVNDQWRAIAVGTGDREMAYGQLSYSQVLTTEGLKLSVAVSRARTQPGDVLRPFDVQGAADTTSISVNYPLLRSRNESLFARVTYDHSDIRTDILGARVIEDRIRALRLGLSWRVLDRFDGQNVLEVDFSQGLGGTGEGDLLKSRAGAKGVFNKLSFDYERAQFFSASTSLAFGVAGQWANTPLLSSEQYALGGRRYGRAYEPAELVGERALALRIEPRYAGILETPGFRSYQTFGFYDIGKVWRIGAPAA